MLSPRAIALQGLGSSSRHVALQGFVIEVSAPPGRRLRMPTRIVDAQRLHAIDDDDTMLMIAAAVAAAYGSLQ